MKITDKAQAALQQPDSRARTVQMTDELREKFSRVAGEVVDLLKARTEGPMEAYMILQFVMHGFEDSYGIRGGIILDKDDAKN